MSDEGLVTSGSRGNSIADRAASGSWSGIFGGGLAAIADAAKAVAVAVETQQLSVDPHLVDAMIKKLTAMKDELASIAERRNELSQETKIGGGYAMAVSRDSMNFGRQAAQQITELGKAIDSLKTQIEKSRASYHNADQAGSDSFNKINGKS
ncbi:hypothetical protein [Lentzea flava]|uniref:Excreted virulence factor EspC, type VII ESX diderm n=1 Tax=Lentzea flava TaxID=103732 RepID=A0ABQ2UTS8_9PSEU|nr:hypothetical protein [Lentzea flava]MCP2201599.1 hypothetical protein [Lentzea flava]GGU53398.1 hypothetical protein GCM10010178_52860 [Lentzea flava]